MQIVSWQGTLRYCSVGTQNENSQTNVFFSMDLDMDLGCFQVPELVAQTPGSLTSFGRVAMARADAVSQYPSISHSRLTCHEIS